jgi:hypothetical protein
MRRAASQAQPIAEAAAEVLPERRTLVEHAGRGRNGPSTRDVEAEAQWPYGQPGQRHFSETGRR